MPSQLAVMRFMAVLGALVILMGWGESPCWAAADGDAPRQPAAAQTTPSSQPPEIAESINRFGFDLYGRVGRSENLVVSPASIASVVAMAYSGARGETARQIARTMHFRSLPEDLHLAFAAFEPGQRVLSYSFGARGIENEGYGLKVTEVLANSAAAKIGLRANDLILSINGQTIRTAGDYAEAIDRSEGKIRVQWFNYERGSVEVREVGLSVGSTAPEAPTRLEMINAVWAQQEYDFLPAYVDLLKAGYRGHFGEVDFEAQPGQSRELINRWIEEKTYQRIRELLSPDAVTAESRLILTNTLYFKGRWKRPFAPSKTSPGKWQVEGVSGGKVVEVPMMSQTQSFPYLETEQFQALELPYQESSLALVVVLPKANLPWEEFQSALRAPGFLASLDGLRPTWVRVGLPRFRSSTRLSLKELLAPDMPLAFSEEADFSGMCEEGRLKISAIVHMAYIDVDEAGTEAGGGSAVTTTIKKPAEAEFIANRPFAFLLRDRTSQTILFLGHLVNPVD